MHPELIDTPASLVTFLDQLGDCKGQPPSLYIDLEGNDLSRHGTLALATMLVDPQQKLYLIDVTTLQNRAFDTCGSNGHSLRSILESKEILKVFFDIRNDSDALFSLYGVRVDGIEDLQLMELATRDFNKRCVNGLAKCIERDSTLGYAEKRDWQRVKDDGRKLFDPARGGSFAVFDRRPIDPELIKYCAQDVTLMPHLREKYCRKLCDAWWVKIASQTEKRIQQSQQPGFNGKGRHMALGPTEWMAWHPAAAEKGIRTLFEISRPREDIVVKDSSPTKSGVAVTEDTGSRSSSLKAMNTDVSPAVKDEASGATLQDGLTQLTVTDATTQAGMQHARSTGPSNQDDEDEVDEFEYRSRYFSDLSWYGSIGDDADSGGDFAACDRECGYCGRCPY